MRKKGINVNLVEIPSIEEILNIINEFEEKDV